MDPALAKVLSHRLRGEILDRFSAGSATPVELARALDQNVATISYHLRVLREAGYPALDGEAPPAAAERRRSRKRNGQSLQ